ncbi:MAG: TIGR04283 family arsenosugar biosynthesis glycosyltransferase [Gemmatimonadota bacterium]|nr:MAG: TIGR04283 family arsenosugar biosynthesis glycosyltransferase [Gemmatimonadota bacterium]
MISISIIIPTLNESDTITALLRYLQELDPKIERIVADGESSDDTVRKARPLAQVVQATRGRGSQMNAGAYASSGDVLWFLHADCRPHHDSLKAIRGVLRNQKIVGGGFQYCLHQIGFHYRIAETLSNYKNRVLGLLYGDMGVFVRRPVFNEMGGYTEIPLMEDMDFSRRLKRFGDIVILPHKIQTSARRWVEEGYVKNSVRSWMLQSGWALGISPHRLARFYRFHEDRESALGI